MKRRKKSITAAATVLAVLAFAAYFFFSRPDTNEYPPDKLTIAVCNAGSSVLVCYAKDKNLFKKNGIDARIKRCRIGSPPESVLGPGKADVAIVTDFVFAASSFKHHDLKIISVTGEEKTSKFVVRKDKGIQKVPDLTGKKIAISRGSRGGYYLNKFLDAYRLRLSDLDIIKLEPSRIEEEIIEGKIDAGFGREFDISRIKQALGDKLAVWDGQPYSYSYFLLVTLQKWINRHPQLAVRLSKALVEAEILLTVGDTAPAGFLEESFDYSGGSPPQVLENNIYSVYLPQALLLELENQAAWCIQNGLTEAEEIPNYLDFIYSYALEAEYPERVNIIK